MSSTELFKKHFGDQSASVDLKHPNMEKFFSELNEESLRVINTLPRWQPAIHKNRFVSVYYLLPVAYVLE